MGAAPLASVIIATYNWSAALRCAIRSVQRQTVQDFEILVVGDACTDDSEAVVAAFGDPRIAWANLPENTGSQQAPNNVGLAMARGEWIAYLGHDDIWAPRHLETTIGAARGAAAHAAVGGMILYGAPGSGAMSTAGLFADHRCADADFVPPSALVHRRALIDRIGSWTDPRTLRLPTDCEFFLRARALAPIASSGEITVFKFTAAARRNAYQTKSTDEQTWCLAGLERGDRFVAQELAKVVVAVAAGRWNTITFPDVRYLEPGELHRRRRIVKGVEHRFADGELHSLVQTERFGLEGEPTSEEWHPMQNDPVLGSFRWTSVSARSTIELPVRFDQPLTFRLHVLAASDERALRDLVVLAQGAPIGTTVERAAAGGWIIAGGIEPSMGVSPVPYVQITLSGVTSSLPLDGGDRRGAPRRQGLAVNWVELSPAA